MTTILNNGKAVTTEAQLNAAIAQANAEGAGAGAFEIKLTGKIALTGALSAIDLAAGVTLDIAGGAATLDGGGAERGLFVYSGVVTVENLTIQNMAAHGGNGFGGGGGGAGLGGGLYVADDTVHGAAAGDVTLTNVTFKQDSAIGGAGAAGSGGGGGGLGGSAAGAAGGPGLGGNGYGAGGNGSSRSYGGGGGSFGGGGGYGRARYYPGTSAGGTGGFGGGYGGGRGGRGGGGGMGGGGDIFVQQGATLTINGGSLAAGTVTAGAGAAGGSSGAAAGAALLLQGDESVTLAPNAGQKEVFLAGMIADVSGTSGAGYSTGGGALVVNGAGTVDLATANAFGGGVTIEQGTLELGAAGAAGSGAITFASAPGVTATLTIDAAATPGNQRGFGNAIADFGAGAAIDMKGLAYTAGATATVYAQPYGGDVLAVISNGETINFALAGPTAANYAVSADASGDVLVAAAPAITTEARLNAAILGADRAAAGSGAIVIDLAGNIALTGALTAINLKSGVTLDIEGGGFALNGAGDQAGLDIQAGVVTIENLTIADAAAEGASGGGAGQGGGLSLGAAANATLTNVAFTGDQAIGGSGGGLAEGGDIYLQQGALLNIAGASSLSGGTATGSGPAYGGGVFIQGNQTVTFAPASGATETVADVIADTAGSTGQPGAGAILINGPGTLILSASNSFTGGITVEQGTLDLAAAGAAGAGAVTITGGAVNVTTSGAGGAGGIVVNGGALTLSAADAAGTGLVTVEAGTAAFTVAGAGGTGGLTVAGGSVDLAVANAVGSGPVTLSGGVLEVAVAGAAGAGTISFASQPPTTATLQIDAAATPANGQSFAATIANFGINDTIDLKGLTYAAGATATLTGNVLAVTSDGTTVDFNVATPGASNFYVQTDGAGGAAVKALLTTVVTTEAGLNAAILQADNAQANSGSYQIDLGGDITLTTGLQAINLKSGVTLDIEGGGATLDGGGTREGLFVYSGVTTIENLTIQNMVAHGSGGGAGLGGGLFVADDAADGAAPGVVTLNNVSFNNDSAIGGDGGGGGGFDYGSGVYLGDSFGEGGYGGSTGYQMRDPPPGETGGVAGGNGGNGGFGGGGGGGGGGYWFQGGGWGGQGGFGAGNGGYGGYGGDGNDSGGNGGPGSDGGGGGGLGAGGDIFVQQGASLIIAGGSSLGAGTVAGGAGAPGGPGYGPTWGNSGGGPGGPGTNGEGFGNGIFLQGYQSVVFAPGAGQTETVTGVIADQTGSGGWGANAGTGSVIVDGPGTLALAAANSFTGGVAIDQGALELATPGAAGWGSIYFQPRQGATATLILDAAATPPSGQTFATTLFSFGNGDAIDLKALGYGYESSATLLGDTLIVTSDERTVVLTLANPGSGRFYVHDDGNHDVLVNDIPSVAPPSYSWKTGSSADWGTASAWSAGVTPNSLYTDATIKASGTFTVGIATGENFDAQNLTMNSGRATLDIGGALTVLGGLTLSAGAIQLASGSLLAALDLIAAHAKIVGLGTLGGAIQNAGGITASGGLLDLTGGVTGKGGVLTIDNGATLELGGAASGNVITFATGAKAVLKLDSPGAVSSVISGFTAADTIDIDGATVTSDLFAGGVLTLFDGSVQLGSLAMAGSFKGLFALSADGNGGTDITLAADKPPVLTVPGAQALEVNRAIAISGVSVADADAVAANQTITVTLTDKFGMLSVTNGAGGSVTGSGTSKLSIVGSLAQVDADLASLTYNGAQPGVDAITLNAADNDGGKAKAAKIAVTTKPDTTLVLNGGQPVTTETQLNAAIAQANAAQANSGVYQIDLGGNIGLTSELTAISLKAGVTLDIEGGGNVLDRGYQEGLFVYAGAVTIEDLTIQNMVARGGGGNQGGPGGTGGAAARVWAAACSSATMPRTARSPAT